MEGKHIQLHYGVLSNNKPKNLLHFNLLPNFKRDILFEQFPYLSHVKNSTLNILIKNGIVDKLSFKNTFWLLVCCKIVFSKVSIW